MKTYNQLSDRKEEKWSVEILECVFFHTGKYCQDHMY